LVDHIPLPPSEYLYMPQEIPSDQGRAILSEIRGLPKPRLAEVMAIVRRLGSDPVRLIQSDAPSPGESRKMRIALGIAYAPALIVLDEPTNHLDLPSIIALEEALADCACGLLLVSHDFAFLDKLTTEHWAIEAEDADEDANRLNPFAQLG
jgi:ATPase subunit of ABC transporter with duplicated ATPase domains